MYQLLLAASHSQVTSRVKAGAQRYRELPPTCYIHASTQAETPERLPHGAVWGAMGSLARDVVAVELPAAARF